MSVTVDTPVLIYDDFSRLLFLHVHREASPLDNDIPEESGQFRMKRSVGLILLKASVMRISIPLDLSWLCARLWLARHPAKIEITRSSGGSSHHTNFFFLKNHDFSPFLINFSTVVVVKHTHLVDPKRLTHIHSHRDLNSLSLSTQSTYLLVPMP